MAKITIRHLLSMSSGIHDYDNGWYTQWILLRGGSAAEGGGGCVFWLFSLVFH